MLTYNAKWLDPNQPEQVAVRQIKAFSIFLLNDNYIGHENDGYSEFKKPKKPTIVLFDNGRLCESGYSKHTQFLQMYLKLGSSFILRLEHQANMSIRSGKARFKFVGDVAA